MGLYVVPQTADPTDPTVAAAVARLRVRAPKPEALAGIPDDTVALHIEEAYDLARSALADRLTEGAVLLKVDAAVDGAVMKVASMTLYRERGKNRQAGADDSIEMAGAEGLAYFERCKPGGANGKSENPRFITSDNVTVADAPWFTSALGGPGGSGRSDAFVDARSQLPGGRGEWH